MTTFTDFWNRFFSGTGRFDAAIEAAANGRAHFPPGSKDKLPEMLQKYLDDYGVYNPLMLQQATIEEIERRLALGDTGAKRLVSLGSGPGVYALWLLYTGKIGHATLVDPFKPMLDKATEIAKAIGVADKVTTVHRSVKDLGPFELSVDIVLAVNALHCASIWDTWLVRTQSFLLASKGEFFMTYRHDSGKSLNEASLRQRAAGRVVIKHHGNLNHARVRGQQQPTQQFIVYGTAVR